MIRFLLFPGSCFFVQGGRPWSKALHLSGLLCVTAAATKHVLQPDPTVFSPALKRAKSPVFVQSGLYREKSARPSEKHPRTDAEIPSPFQDAATHDDLREGPGRLLLFIRNVFSSLQLICPAVQMCVHVCACARMCMPGFPVPIPPSLVSWACPTVQAPFPGLFREIPTHWLPAFYVLMVAFSLVTGIGLLAALLLLLPSLHGSVFFAGVAFLPLFYFILFFLLTETRARPSSPLQDLLRTSRYRFTAAGVLVIAQLLRVLINPAALGAS